MMEPHEAGLAEFSDADETLQRALGQAAFAVQLRTQQAELERLLHLWSVPNELPKVCWLVCV